MVDPCQTLAQERLLEEAKAASADAAGALVAEMNAMRENALTAALAEARASVAALQRQHEAGQNSLAELQVRQGKGFWGLICEEGVEGRSVEGDHSFPG